MKKFNSKKIFIVIPPHNDFFKSFEDNLNYVGFSQIITTSFTKFKYKNIKDRIINLIQKTFFKNKEYKSKLISKFHLDENLDIINKIQEPLDYSLIIRGDLLHPTVLNKLIEKSKASYTYHWDGLDRYKEIYKFIPFFKKAYIFDKNDIKTKNCYPATNFYFDCYPQIFDINTKPKYDLYYIGSYDDRIDQLIEICEKLYHKGLKLNINIPCPTHLQKKLQKYPYINFPKNGMTYKENLEQIADAKVILDLQNKVHNGLSFRHFESLGYDKKLITTNSLVKKYDFYNENNICVYENIEQLIDFINKPYIKIDTKIKHKYSFTNWIDYILEQKDCIKINFP